MRKALGIRNGNTVRKAVLTAAAAVCLLLSSAVLLRSCGPEDLSPRRQAAGTKVGLLLLGSRSDRGFSQSIGEAAEAACRELGVPFALYDNVPVGEPFVERAEQLIGQGCGLILCDNVAYDADLPALAAAYPNICFFSASGTVTGHNLSSCMRRTYQARYLTGLAAGSVSRTGEIGYVLAGLTPETIRQLNAFTIGVRRANPEAVVYCRQANNWDDGAAAADQTETLLDAHNIDVLSHHTTTIAPLRVADERGVWTIGSGYDNSALFPDTWLTGCVFNWKPFLEQRIAEWRQGRFVGQRYWGGINTGLVDITPLHGGAVPEAGALLEAERRRLCDGTYDVFFGPLRDVYGTVQVRQDENLSDEKILHGMYWFVDGVAME